MKRLLLLLCLAVIPMSGQSAQTALGNTKITGTLDISGVSNKPTVRTQLDAVGSKFARVGYVDSTNGSNTTGTVGDIARPFLTAQAAYTAGARILEIRGTGGNLSIGQSITVRGCGLDTGALASPESTLGTVTFTANAQIQDAGYQTVSITAIVVTGRSTIELQSVRCGTFTAAALGGSAAPNCFFRDCDFSGAVAIAGGSGQAGGDSTGGGTGSDGAPGLGAGYINAIRCRFNGTVTLTAGAGGAGGRGWTDGTTTYFGGAGGAGGAGGVIEAYYSRFLGDFTARGGNGGSGGVSDVIGGITGSTGGAGGNSGTGGAAVLKHCETSAITVTAGTVGSGGPGDHAGANGTAGAGGTVIARLSEVYFITAGYATWAFQGSIIANVFVADSVFP